MQDQLFAAIALGNFQGDAKSAVPALLDVLKIAKAPLAAPSQTNISQHLYQRELRRHVEQDLQQIDPESYSRFVTNAVPAQPNSLDFFTVPNDPF